MSILHIFAVFFFCYIKKQLKQKTIKSNAYSNNPCHPFLTNLFLGISNLGQIKNIFSENLSITTKCEHKANK